MKDDAMQYSENLTETGFVFAPFDLDEKALLFPIENARVISEKVNDLEFFLDERKEQTQIATQKNHIDLVQKTIQKINESSLQKIVISRKELVAISNFDLIAVYQKLIATYKSAFVYVWFHPKVGLWLGATPETLLHVQGSYFETMSLAGTQVVQASQKIVWGLKELEEQQLVTNFIENQLEHITKNLVINQKESVQAGNLLHLKTKISGNFLETTLLKDLVNALHPTPAVCGLPREAAKKFILENERYHRGFYTGFLGEINLKNELDAEKKSVLFVNLRCMQILQEYAAIFVGGGITKDSNALKEWQETVSKSYTMKKVLS